MKASVHSTSQPARSHFTEAPNIDLKYGAASWRPEQSVIDIFQNHLDAQQRACPGSVPGVQLLLEHEGKKRWVNYENVAEQSSSWVVTGFRVSDKGSGFHHGFLGLIGPTTKSSSALDRGGLGEGLKMSIAQLMREDCAVHLVSSNRDGTWHCKPYNKDGTLEFGGTQLPRAVIPPGSCTVVRLSPASLHFHRISRMLDPRVEGIGRYILDFDPNLPDFNIHNDQIVPLSAAGRIYVKGLFVEQIADALFSYNLGSKWSIAGRDRNHISSEVLKAKTCEILAQVSIKEVPEKLFRAIAGDKDVYELSLLSGTLNITSPQDEVWRQMAQSVLGIGSGKVILVPNTVLFDEIRRLRENGFQPVILKLSNSQQEFFDRLFPDVVVTWDAYCRTQEANLDKVFGPSIEKARHANAPEHSVPVPAESLTKPSIEKASAESELFVRRLIKSILEDCLRKQVPTQIYLGKVDIVKGEEVRFSKRSDGYVISVPDHIHPKDGLAILSALFSIAVDATKETVESQNLVTSLIDYSSWLGPKIIQSALPIVPSIPLNMLRAQLTASPDYVTCIGCLSLAEDAHKLLTAPNVDEEQIKKFPSVAVMSNKRIVVFGGRPYFHAASGLYVVEPDGRLNPTTIEQVRAGSPTKIRDVNTTQLFQNYSQDFSVSWRGLDGDSITQIARLLELIRKYSRDFDGSHPLDMPPETFHLLFQDIKSSVFDSPDTTPNNNYKPPLIRDGELFCAGRGSQILILDRSHDSHLIRIFSRAESAKETNEFFVRILTRKDQIFFSVEGNDHYSAHIGRGEVIIPGALSVRLDYGVLHVRNFKPEGVYIEENCGLSEGAFGFRENEEVDENYGKPSMVGTIDVSYGAHVWDNPLRPLLDCIQNHMDASNGARPEISFLVSLADGSERLMQEDELKTQSQDVKILEFSFADKGAGFGSYQLLRLGSSTKTPKDRGQFGEGLKLLVCACTRNGVGVQMQSRNWQANANTFTQTLPDYAEGKTLAINLLGFDIEWSDNVASGSRSAFSKPKTGNKDNEFWDNLCSLVDPRITDQETHTSGIDRFIQTSPASIGFGQVELLHGPKGRVYENGLLLGSSTGANLAFSYNILGKVTQSRERDKYEDSSLKELLMYSVPHFVINKGFRREITEQLIMHRPATLEASCIYKLGSMSNSVSAALVAEFDEISEGAGLLSWKPELNRRRNILDIMLSRSPFEFSSFEWSRDNINPVEAYERRLQNAQEQWNEASEVVASEGHFEQAYQLIVTDSTGFNALKEAGVPDAKQMQEFFDAAIVNLEIATRESALEVLRSADLFFIRRVRQLLDNGSYNDCLASLGITNEKVEALAAEVANRNDQEIEWRAESWMCLGLCLGKGETLYAYNAKLLGDTDRLFTVHVHELVHRLTGKKDYTPSFQQALLLFMREDLVLAALNGIVGIS